MAKNNLKKVDFYKICHWMLYPENTTRIYAYGESRGGGYPATLVFGLQGFLKENLIGQFFTQKDIDDADNFYKEVFGFDYFNKKGWQYILDKYNGRLHVSIKSVKEGSLVPLKNALLTVENTDPECFWLTQYIETMLLRALWYPTTVASTSFWFKRIVKKYAEKTGCEVSPFHLCDFGGRGVSSHESAAIGGAAHLCHSFLGTDTGEGVEWLMENYNAPVCGFSVIASEHACTTIYGKQNEQKAYERFLNQVPNGAIISIVIDSYDSENAVKNILGKELKEKILKRTGRTVLRPDSGDATKVPTQVAEWVWDVFGGTINAKGYKVLNEKISIIQGDGISLNSLPTILENLTNAGFATSNLIFGMGGQLLQGCNRDTFQFAMKASAGEVDGQWIDIYKDPVTDSCKKSKRGRLKLIKENNQYKTVRLEEPGEDQLVEVFRDGRLLVDYSLNDVKNQIAADEKNLTVE